MGDEHMTAEQKEAYVRSRWDHMATRREPDGQWLFFTSNALYRAFRANSLRELFNKGYEFTLAREEEIRLVEFDVRHIRQFHNAVSEYIDGHPNAENIELERGNLASWRRILAREQAALDTLREGLRA